MESEDQEPLPAAPNIPWPPPPPPPSGQGTRRSLVNSGDAASSAPSPLPVMTPHQKRLDDQLLHLELELLDALQPPVPRTRRVSSGPRGQSMRSSLYAQSLPPVPEKPLKYQQHRNSSMKRLGMLIFISMSIVSLLIVMLVLTVPDCAPLTGCQLGTVYADLRAQLFSDATRFNSSNSMIVTWNAQTMQAYPQLSGLYQYVMQTRHDPFATAELTSDLLSIRLYNVTMPKSIGELPASLRFPSMHLDNDDDDDGKLGVERKVGLGPPICGRLAPSSPVLGFRASSVLAHSSSSQNTKEVQSMNELISNHTNTALQGMDASSVSSVQSPTDWSARSPTPPLDTMAFCCLEVYAKEGDRWMMGGQARVQRHQVQGRFLCTSGKLIGGIWVGWSDLIKTAEEHQPMEPLSSSPAMVRRTTVNNDTSTPFSRSWLAKLRTGVEASQFQVGGQWWQPITGVQVATETVAGVTKGVSLVHAVAVPWTTWPFIDTLFREQNGTTLANMTMMSHLPFSRHPPMKRITLNDGRFRFLLRQQDIETSRLVPSPWLMYPFQGYFGGASLSLGGLSLPRMYKITLQQQPVWFLNATGCPVAYHRSGSFCWSPSLSSRDVEIQFKDEYRVQSFVGKKETKQPVILRVVRVQVLYRPVNVNLSLWNNKLRRVPHPIPKLPLEITIQRHWDFNQDVRRRRNHTRRMGRLFRLTDGAESIDTTNSLDLSEAPNRGAIWEELDDIHWKQVNRFTFNTNVRDGSLLFGYEMVRNSDPVMLTVSMPQSNDLIVPRSLVLVPQDQDQLTKQERRREGKTAGLYDWNQVLKYHAFLKTVVLSTFQTNVSNMDAYNSSMDRGVYAKLPSVSRLGELPLPYRNLNASIDVYMDSLLNSGRILYPKNPLAFELRSSVSSALELFTLPAGDGDRFVPKIRYGLYEWKEQTRVNDFYLQQLRRTFQSTMRYVSSFLNSKDVERNVSVLEYVVKQAHVIADLAQSLDNHIDGIPMERLIAFYQIMRPFADEFYKFLSNGVKVNAGLFKNVMIDWSTKTTSQNKAVTPPVCQKLIDLFSSH